MSLFIFSRYFFIHQIILIGQIWNIKRNREKIKKSLSRKIRKKMKKKIGREIVFFIFFPSIKNQEFSFQTPENLLPICHVFYIGAEIYYERFSLHINKCGGGNIEHH